MSMTDDEALFEHVPSEETLRPFMNGSGFF